MQKDKAISDVERYRNSVISTDKCVCVCVCVCVFVCVCECV